LRATSKSYVTLKIKYSSRTINFQTETYPASHSFDTGVTIINYNKSNYIHDNTCVEGDF